MKFLIAFLSAMFLSTAALADNVVYKASLSGANQVPKVTTNVSGEFIFTTENGNWYLVALGAARDDTITAAHIHCGRPGVNGPVIYPFFGGETARRNLLVKGQFDDSKFASVPISEACPIEIKNMVQLRLALRQGLIYVNVHTQKYPGGIVRGQVFRLI